jgi:hypothetical protein
MKATLREFQNGAQEVIKEAGLRHMNLGHLLRQAPGKNTRKDQITTFCSETEDTHPELIELLFYGHFTKYVYYTLFLIFYWSHTLCSSSTFKR